MKLELIHLFLLVEREIEETPTQLRGFIGSEFAKYPKLHHHINANGDRKLLYSYPMIQYKINRDRAIILGIGDDAISVLHQVVLHIQKLNLGTNSYTIKEIKVHYEESEFNITQDEIFHTYKFISPWVALNKNNYTRYKNASIENRRILLHKILIGNILSISKYLGYTVPSEIKVNTELYPAKITYKNIDMIAFRGIFEANFMIPDYLGIGRKVSHGYGTVKKVISINE